MVGRFRQYVCLSLVSTLAASAIAEIPDAQLQAIRDGFNARRDSMLERQVRNTYPPTRADSDEQLYCWNRLDFALAAFYLDVQNEEANRAVLEVAARGTSQQNATGEERFHWLAPLLIRIYELSHAESAYFPGRLSDEAEQGIRQVLWEYASSRCRRDLFTPDRLWWCWGSENHDAQRTQSFWGAAKILAASPAYAQRPFADGHTPVEHYAALDKFVQQRFRERIQKGLLAETASPGYAKYTLAGWYNYSDFGSPETRRLAQAALTVWWADWAQEQINAVRGGAKARVYQGSSAQTAGSDAASSMAWYYLGIGTPQNAHPGVMCMATSEFRLPLVVMDIALDVPGRGRYEYRSRRPGLAKHAGKEPRAKVDGMNVLDPKCRGLVRYTYCTPEFIVGSWFLAKRPWSDWVGFSSQNRWQGIVFAGQDDDARIFPQCEGLRNGKTYNQYWSVQDKGAMIVQRLPSPEFSKQAGDMRVFFSPRLRRREVQGWIFAEADRAYAAVRFLGDEPTYRWDDDKWARARDSGLPVIFQVSSKQDHESLDAFIRAVLACRCDGDSQKVVYQGLGECGTLTMYFSESRLPEVDGRPIELNPSKAFDSPFLQEAYPTGLVTIAKDSRKLVLDAATPASK